MGYKVPGRVDSGGSKDISYTRIKEATLAVG